MQVTCPNCARRLGDDEAGKVYRCRHCGEIFRAGEGLPRPDNHAWEIADSQHEITSPPGEEGEATESPDVGGGPETDQHNVQLPSETTFPNGDRRLADMNEIALSDNGASEQQVTGQFVVKCPKCGEGHAPGIFRCTKCNTCLRPTFLGVITLIGPIILILLVCTSLAQVAEHPVALVPFCICIVGIFTLFGLRAGRYWAWIAIQVIWVINIAFSATEAIAINPILLVGTAVQVLIIVPLWTYIDSERVKAFCSVGRPSKWEIPDNLEDREKDKNVLPERRKRTKKLFISIFFFIVIFILLIYGVFFYAPEGRRTIFEQRDFNRYKEIVSKKEFEQLQAYVLSYNRFDGILRKLRVEALGVDTRGVCQTMYEHGLLTEEWFDAGVEQMSTDEGKKSSADLFELQLELRLWMNAKMHAKMHGRNSDVMKAFGDGLELALRHVEDEMSVNMRAEHELMWVWLRVKRRWYHYLLL